MRETFSAWDFNEDFVKIVELLFMQHAVLLRTDSLDHLNQNYAIK